MEQISFAIDASKALNVACPLCLADIGQPCVGVRGKPRQSVHRDRIEAAPKKPKTRKSIPPRVRFTVFKRDGFTCQYCGATPPAVILHLDHVVAVANGGSDDEVNLITSCSTCNLGKGAEPLSLVPLAVDKRLAIAKERVEQSEAYAAFVEEQDRKLDDQVWDVSIALFKAPMMTLEQRVSTRQFLKRLALSEVLEAARLAELPDWPSERSWLYFCGICWKKIKGTYSGR